jgi:hypothetical protein
MGNSNYKYCIDCFLPEGGTYSDGECVKFYDSKTWQHNQRCCRCEDLYVYEFVTKYPNTKSVNYVELDNAIIEKTKYQQSIKFHGGGCYNE